MTPAELIAKLTLSAKCDCPEFSRDIAREMLGAALEMQRLNLELAEDLRLNVRVALSACEDIDRTESIACAWAFDLGREMAKESPTVVVLRCPACRYEWALEGPLSAVDLAAMVCSSVHCRRTEPRPRLEVAR